MRFFQRKGKQMTKLAVLLTCIMLVTYILPAFGSVSLAASKPEFAKEYTYSYVGKYTTYTLENLRKGYTVTWNISEKVAGYVSLSGSDQRLLTKTVAVTGTKSETKIYTLSSAGKKIGTSYQVTAQVFNSKGNQVATLTDDVKISQDAKKVSIINKPENDTMYTIDSFNFNRKMEPANSSNKTFWLVTDENGVKIADTKTGVTSPKVKITAHGTFTPIKAGIYKIYAIAYRTQTASVLRAKSLPVTISAIDRKASPTVTPTPTPTPTPAPIATGGSIPSTPVVPPAEAITVAIDEYSADQVYTVDTESISLHGTVATNTGVSMVKATYYSYLNEAVKTIDSTASSSFTISSIPLDIGTNFISVTAKATNGTTATKMVMINRINKVINLSDNVIAFDTTTPEGLREIAEVYNRIVNYWTDNMDTETTLDDEFNIVVSQDNPIYQYSVNGTYSEGDIIFIPRCELFPTGLSLLYQSHDDNYVEDIVYNSEEYEVIHTQTPGYSDIFKDPVSIKSTGIDTENPLAFIQIPEGTESPIIEDDASEPAAILSIERTTLNQSIQQTSALINSFSTDDSEGNPEDVIGKGFQFQNLFRHIIPTTDFSDRDKGKIILNFDDMILYDKDGNKETEYDQVTVKGKAGLEDIKAIFGLEWYPSLSDPLPKQLIARSSYTEVKNLQLILGGDIKFTDLIADYKKKYAKFENKRSFCGFDLEGVDMKDTIVLCAVGVNLSGFQLANVRTIQSASILVPFNPTAVFMICMDVEGKVNTQLVFDYETTAYVEKGINIQKDGFIGNFGNCASNRGTTNLTLGDRNINLYDVQAKSKYEQDKLPVSKLTISNIEETEGSAEASLAVGGSIGFMMGGIMPFTLKGTVGPYANIMLRGKLILSSDADPIIEGQASANIRLLARLKVDAKLAAKSFIGSFGLEYHNKFDKALLEFNASTTTLNGKVSASDSDRDLNNNPVLPGAKITLTRKDALPTSTSYYFEALTGDDGRYSISNIASGDYILTVSSEGYATITDEEFTVSESEEKNFYLDSSATSTASLSGIVTEADLDTNGANNLPISGIVVTLTKIGSSLQAQTQGTEGTGRYSFANLPLGLYEITILDNNYIPLTSEILISSTTANIYNITLEAINNSYFGNGVASGRVINALTGQGVEAGLTLSVRRGYNVTDGNEVASVVTDVNGTYSLNLAAGNYTVHVIDNRIDPEVRYRDGHFNIKVLGSLTIGEQNGEVTPILDNDEIRIVLSWGSTPRDLDSHLNGPTNDGSRFHTYFSDEIFNSNDIMMVQLDVDDTTSYGPETTTIYHQTNGIYKFTVHDYTNLDSSSSMALANSGAYVRVYIAGNLETYYVPNQEGTAWDVFEYNSETGTINVLNNMYYHSDPDTIGSPDSLMSARSFINTTERELKDYEKLEKEAEEKAAETIQDENALEETNPEGTTPEETKPEVIIPEVVSPEETEPEVIIPEVVTPEETKPEVIIPEVVTPEETVPEVIIPEVVTPEETTPEAAATSE